MRPIFKAANKGKSDRRIRKTIRKRAISNAKRGTGRRLEKAEMAAILNIIRNL